MVHGTIRVDRSLFRFILRYSKRDQLLIVPLVVATMVVYYLSLDLPKTIINQAIQGTAFKQADTTHWLGLDLERLPYLLALSILFLGLIVLNGWLKFQINTMKGWMGERMLRRLRYALAGRIAECVDGAAEIHAHDTSNYERAEISARLGRIFRIRFELYQRKFMVKFLNNFLSQVTPFLFYTVGGYLVVTGQLDIGALVAVIAAYKDLPSPVKELIDWDQQRLDVEIKYNQVVEQFTAEDVAPPEMQSLVT